MTFNVLILISLLSLSLCELPKNGTFIFTKYNDPSCQSVESINGFSPESLYWNYDSIMSPQSYDNSTSILSYKTCSSINTANECVGESQSTMECKNECKDQSTCNFIPTSNLSIFTFTGYSDGGCNNVNGESYALKATNYCWKLKGKGSFSWIQLDDRTLVVDQYESDDCTGIIVKKNQKIKCNEKCVDNPLANDEDVHYTCKYTSIGYIELNTLLLLLLFLILF